MQKNKKLLGVLSTAAIASLFTAALSTNVSAAMDGIVVNDVESGKNIQFNKAELQESFRQVMRGSDEGTALWESFEEYANKEGNDIVSYHDDQTGYVSAESVRDGFRDSMREGTDFDLDTFTEAAEGEETLENLATAVVGEDGVITLEDEEEVVDSSDLKLDSVEAVGSDKVEVTLEDEVDAVSAKSFEIVKKGGSEVLDVTEATVDGDTVLLTVEGLKGGEAYTLTVNEVSKNFTSVNKETDDPKVESAKSSDYGVVTVEFDMKLDEETAEDIANYSISDSKVEIVEAKLNSDRKSVDLTITGWKKNHRYSVTVENVESVDGVAMKSKSRAERFTAKDFRYEPKIKRVDTLNNRNNTKVKVEFTSEFELDEESAEDIANYSIKEGLEIISAEYTYKRDDKVVNEVVLTTAEQEKGKRYHLTISGIQDTSANPNAMEKAKTEDFTGGYEDKTGPKIKEVTPISATRYEVQFTDDNALDEGSALDASNYSFDKDLEVLSVEWYDEDAYKYEQGGAGQRVVLTTTDPDENNYRLTITGVQDEFGAEMKKERESVRAGVDVERPPYIALIKATDDETIEIGFKNGESDRVAKLTLDASAKDPTNYVIYDGDDLVSSALSVEWKNDDHQGVKLTVPSLDKGKEYTVKINNVSDVLGNVIEDLSVKVTVTKDSSDNERPNVEYMDSRSEKEVVVEFNEEVELKSTAYLEVYPADQFKADDSTELKDGATGKITLNAKFVYDEKNVMFVVAGNNGEPSELTDNKDYRVAKSFGITDTNNNLVEVQDDDELEGYDGDVEAPRLDYGEQVNAKKLKLVFTKPIVADKTKISGLNNIEKVDYDDTDTWDDYCTVYVELSRALKDGETYKVNVSAVKDYAGKTVSLAKDLEDDEKIFEFDAYNGDDIAPEFLTATPVTNTKIELEFDEDIDSDNAGKYVIKDEDKKSIDINESRTEVDDNIVTLYLNEKLDVDKEYTLTCSRAPEDIIGNRADSDDIEFDFYGTNIEIDNVITGVAQEDSFTFKVNFFEGDATLGKDEDNNDVLLAADIDSTTDAAIAVSPVLNSTGKVVASKFVVDEVDGYKVPLLSELEYSVKVENEDGDTKTATFKGFVKNDLDIDVDKSTDTGKVGQFDISYREMTDKDVVAVFEIDENGTLGLVEDVTITSTEVNADKVVLSKSPAAKSSYIVVVYRGDDPTTDGAIYNAVSATVKYFE